jgi:hypothetical protein
MWKDKKESQIKEIYDEVEKGAYPIVKRFSSHYGHHYKENEKNFQN